MKVKYRAAVFDISGYGKAARGYVLAMDELGAEIQVVPVSFEYWRNREITTTKRLEELCRRDVNAHIYVNHTTPDVMIFPYGSSVISVTVSEVSHIHSIWVERLLRADHVITFSEFSKASMVRSGVPANKISVVPHGVDVERFLNERRRLRIEGMAGFNFLSVLQWIPRKGYDILLKAYYSTFTRKDDVALILLTWRMDHSLREQMIVRQEIALFRSLYADRGNEARVILLGEPLAEDLMAALYLSVDAFVLPSRGEGFGLPYAEAMAAGLPVIGTRGGGNMEFMNDNNSYLIDTVGERPCWGMEHTLWYPPEFTWLEPSWEHLGELMREVYEHREEARERGMRAQRDMMRFTWREAGRKMMRVLEQFE